MIIWKVLDRDFVLPAGTNTQLATFRVEFDPKTVPMHSGPLAAVRCRRYPSAAPPVGIDAQILIQDNYVDEWGGGFAGLETTALTANIAGSSGVFSADIPAPFCIRLYQVGTTDPLTHPLACRLYIAFYVPVIRIVTTYVRSGDYPWEPGKPIPTTDFMEV